MNRLVLALTLVLISTYANAAYYFNLGEQGKLTVSKDLKKAVIVNGTEVYRNKLATALPEEIDNAGRPYNLSVYYNEACPSIDNCNKPLLSIKSYNDKAHGFYIWTSDYNTKKVIWQKAIMESQVSYD